MWEGSKVVHYYTSILDTDNISHQSPTTRSPQFSQNQQAGGSHQVGINIGHRNQPWIDQTHPCEPFKGLLDSQPYNSTDVMQLAPTAGPQIFEKLGATRCGRRHAKFPENDSLSKVKNPINLLGLQFLIANIFHFYRRWHKFYTSRRFFKWRDML